MAKFDDFIPPGYGRERGTVYWARCVIQRACTGAQRDTLDGWCSSCWTLYMRHLKMQPAAPDAPPVEITKQQWSSGVALGREG